jgi:hypothetical protein
MPSYQATIMRQRHDGLERTEHAIGNSAYIWRILITL